MENISLALHAVLQKSAQTILLDCHRLATEGQVWRSYKLYPGKDKEVMDEGRSLPAAFAASFIDLEARF